jgi:regulatory protein
MIDREMNRKPFRKKKLSKEEGIQKLKHYCGYAERSHQDARQKAYSLGLWKNEVEEIVAWLISEKYLDEERYATQFASSHLNQKKWGRVKITYELKQRQVSSWCIKNALKQINEEEYLRIFQKLAGDKWALLNGEGDKFAKKRKLQDYLLQKGFERDLVIGELKKISAD